MRRQPTRGAPCLHRLVQAVQAVSAVRGIQTVDGPLLSSAWNTFAANTPEPGFGELPGTCAHFIVGRDGTIYQLVRLNVMCRHTVGLNYVAIGIERVGTSDQEILERPRRRSARPSSSPRGSSAASTSGSET